MTRTEDDQMAVLGNFASPVDIAAYGEYRVTRRPGDDRPLYRFTGRITADGSSGFRAEPGRYHLYAGWFCPWSQRTTIQRQLNGLDDVISVSYVDDRRDGRGWAFRDHRGPDPVNGFRLLREAYEATEPGFDGHVSVPTLWDRATGRIVSNDYRFIGIDLATQFGHWSNGADTFPSDRLDEIDELDDWLGPVVNRGVGAAAGSGPAAEIARANLHRCVGRPRRATSGSPLPAGSSDHRAGCAAMGQPGSLRQRRRSPARRVPERVGLRP